MQISSTIEFPNLVTERTTLRLLTKNDAEAVYRHFSDPKVTEFMDIEPCKDIVEAVEIIRFHVEDTGCRWGIFNRSDGILIGTCGYHCWIEGDRSCHQESKAEIGFDLSSAYWGKGYMQEVLKPVIEIGFSLMKLDFIEATVDPLNLKSIRVMEKAGFIKQPHLVDGLLYFTRYKDQ